MKDKKEAPRPINRDRRHNRSHGHHGRNHAGWGVQTRQPTHQHEIGEDGMVTGVLLPVVA